MLQSNKINLFQSVASVPISVLSCRFRHLILTSLLIIIAHYIIAAPFICCGKRGSSWPRDLVLFAGPLSYQELVEVLIVGFGKKNYDMLKRLLGVLRAAGLLRSFDAAGSWVYQSTIAKPFLRYPTNVDSLMASMRALHFRTQPARFARA